eukprot:3939170-Rhodomonas_salina.8
MRASARVSSELVQCKMNHVFALPTPRQSGYACCGFRPPGTRMRCLGETSRVRRSSGERTLLHAGQPCCEDCVSQTSDNHIWKDVKHIEKNNALTTSFLPVFQHPRSFSPPSAAPRPL